MSKSIVVVGGGITGVTTAYSLAKSGFHVTVVMLHLGWRFRLTTI